MNSSELESLMMGMGKDARAAMRELARMDAVTRDQALLAVAADLRANASALVSANQIDYTAAADNGRSGAMLDRLLLNEERIEAIASSVESIAGMPDPLGCVDRTIERPNGLRIERVRVPLGVIGIIFESRPNVTIDAAALCLKSGNAAILRGGTECKTSNRLLAKLFVDAVRRHGIPPSAIQLLPTQDREAVGLLLGGLAGAVDVLVPRGGRSLIERVQRDARVPVIGHLEGLCHVYVHSDANLAMACDIVENAKLRRTGVCGAAETLLIDAAIAPAFLPEIARRLQAGGCRLRGDQQSRELQDGIELADEEDWRSEYLDAVLSVRVVADIDQAIAHIDRYGSGHTDSIVTDDEQAAMSFLQKVDSAIVMHNASTQFADGGEFGMGAEIGIATGRIHARGPVGANELTSYKYRVRGTGQIRPL